MMFILCLYISILLVILYVGIERWYVYLKKPKVERPRIVVPFRRYHRIEYLRKKREKNGPKSKN